MKDEPIGGFIGFELHSKKGIYHPDALAMANGRACFNLFLSEHKPSKVYIPYYTCDALIEPLLLNNIPFEFYSINKELDPEFTEPKIGTKEYFVYVNYFDIKNKTVFKLEKRFGAKLIVDNTQAFFKKKYKKATSFNSCRKFFGVPDGGYLYTQKKITKKFKDNTDYKYEHLVSRIAGRDDIYYREFLENEELLGAGIRGISILSNNILNQVDYNFCKTRRVENFKFLHKGLSQLNSFKIDLKSVGIPHYYPFLPFKFIDKKLLIREKIFIPTLWADALNRQAKGFETERYLTTNLLPLPIDQRYNSKDMTIIVEKLISHLR